MPIRRIYPRNREISADFFKVEGGKGWLFLLTTFLAFLLGETFAPRLCDALLCRQERSGDAARNRRGGVLPGRHFSRDPVLHRSVSPGSSFPTLTRSRPCLMVVDQLHNPVVGGLIIGALLMAVMSSADSALNSSTAIFVKDLFEHQLGWKDRGDGRMLRLARICTAALGLAAILVAILWSDIIGLLLFTYHVWAPAIILPVVVGALSKKRSPRLNRHVFITMIVATVLTLLYRCVATLNSRFDVALFNDSTYDFMNSFDPAVFGVAVSCVVFGALRLLSVVRPKAELSEG